MTIKTNNAKPSAAPPSSRQNLRGALLMMLAMFIFAILDALAKYLTQFHHPLQIAWVRQTGLLLVALVFLFRQGTQVLATQHKVLQSARGVFAALSACLFIIGIAHVPLADATAVTFVAPLFVVMISALFLKEPVGIYRWGAVIVGFGGTLLIVRPGFEGFDWYLLLPLIACGFFALRQILSRYLAPTESVATTICYTAITSFLVLCPAGYLVWETPENGTIILLMIFLALAGSLGEILIISAFQHGLAVVVAPMHYTILIWTVIYGYLLFGQLPDALTWLGGLIIILSGLFTLYREQIRKADNPPENIT